MPPERGRGGPASTSRAGSARPTKRDDVSRDLRLDNTDDRDGTTPIAPPDATIGVRAREQIEALIATRRDRSSRARPNGNAHGGANLGGGGTNEMARLSSAPETEHAKAATAKAMASAHNHEVLRLAALRKDIAPLGSRGTSMDMGGGACGVRASTTRAELELNDRMRVRADDLGVTDDLLHRSDDDADEWEEQGLDVGDYGDLAYDVTEPGDDPNAFDLDLDLDSDSDDEDGDGAKTKGGKKGAKGTKGAKTKEKPRRMTKHERAGLVETHKAHLLCLCARALAYDRAASDPFASAMAASMVPREIAFAVCDDEGNAVANVDEVTRMAKWFAGHIDVVKAGTKVSSRTKGGVKRQSNCPVGGAANLPPRPPVNSTAVADVIVLDESSDDEPTPGTDEHTPRQQNGSDERLPDTNAARLRSRAGSVADAHERSKCGPVLRLCFALANRAATQEEATGLFVAAARGLGCECRTVVALSPVPLRANAAALEKAGILLPPPEELWTVDGVKRNNAVQRSKGKGVKGGKKTLITDKRKSGELKSETTTDSANAGSRFVEPITHWAEVLCRDDGEGTHGGARWVTVVPHAACGRNVNAKRWSFKADAASVDEPYVISGSRESPVMPYVFGFRSRMYMGKQFGQSGQTALTSSHRWGGKDLTRKYAETYSKVGAHRVDEGWLRVTCAFMSSGEKAVDEFRASDCDDVAVRLGLLEVSSMARGACRAEDVHMDAKCLTERVPSSFAELRNHPLWAVERFLSKTQCIHPRFPIKGFIQGECVFPRSCVRELRSAERWKAECRRCVLTSELNSPAKRTHSRIQAARIKIAKDAKAKAKRTDSIRNARENGHSIGTHPPRRKGARSVEEVARAMSHSGNDGANKGDEEEEEEEGDVALYGEWQTEPWDPPGAKDGKVPRNERGNVDLHGAALPPPGCVHVNLPRIARVARDMGVDYAVALVGFEFQRGGKTLPKFEGVVVCEEFEGRLREAHAAEELRRAAEKVEKERKEAKTRWRVLFSAFWTRLSLREEFGHGGELKHGETMETMEIEGEYSYDEDADAGPGGLGKRARLGTHDEENDGGTKRMALGAAARVEEM